MKDNISLIKKYCLIGILLMIALILSIIGIIALNQIRSASQLGSLSKGIQIRLANQQFFSSDVNLTNSITCNSNTDCGSDKFIGIPICQNQSVMQNFITFTCNNPGTEHSSCSNSSNLQLKQTCISGQSCISGVCFGNFFKRCSTTAQCGSRLKSCDKLSCNSTQGICINKILRCGGIRKFIRKPVCGCNGVTYINDCYRINAGAAKSHDGACLKP